MVTTADYLRLHFIVFLWGFTAILGMKITLPPVELIFFRTVLSAVGMGIIVLAGRGSLDIGKKDILGLLFTGVLVAIHWIAFFGSARLSNVSVSLVGFATASLWTAFIEPISQRKKIKGFEVFLGLCVIAGIVIVFSYQYSYRTGFIVAIFSGFMAAVFAVINARYATRVDPKTITFYEMTGAALATALFFPVYTRYWATDGILRLTPTGEDWIYLLILAGVCTVYAFTAMVRLMKRISVFFIQLTINLEPVYGILLALVFFGERERMDFRFYLGTAIVIGALLAYPFLKRRYEKPIPSDGWDPTP